MNTKMPQYPTKAEYLRQWKIRNREKLNAWARERRKDPAVKERHRQAKQRWDERNPEKLRQHRRNYKLKINYGITQADFSRMIAEQNGVCPGCGTILTRSSPVDHSHVTGKVRGILCSKCNVTLGQAQDSVFTLQNLIHYLEKNSE